MPQRHREFDETFSLTCRSPPSSDTHFERNDARLSTHGNRVGGLVRKKHLPRTTSCGPDHIPDAGNRQPACCDIAAGPRWTQLYTENGTARSHLPVTGIGVSNTGPLTRYRQLCGRRRWNTLPRAYSAPSRIAWEPSCMCPGVGTAAPQPGEGLIGVDRVTKNDSHLPHAAGKASRLGGKKKCNYP